MAKRRGKFPFVRLGVIVAVGAICITGAEIYRRSRRPAPAPADVQSRGLQLVGEILSRIGSTQFGRSRRGALLTEAISGLVRRDRVVFTADITQQALYRRELGGYEVLYVKVLRLSGRFVQQTTEEIAEGLYHEAVHARQSGNGESSIEEECDGYAAGLCAGAALAGRTLPDVLTLSGEPVAQFVAKAYPDLPRRPAYQPVGESRDWLIRRTSLR